MDDLSGWEKIIEERNFNLRLYKLVLLSFWLKLFFTAIHVINNFLEHFFENLKSFEVFYFIYIVSCVGWCLEVFISFLFYVSLNFRLLHFLSSHQLNTLDFRSALLPIKNTTADFGSKSFSIMILSHLAILRKLYLFSRSNTSRTP